MQPRAMLVCALSLLFPPVDAAPRRFKLELQGIELMTPAAWKKFIADSLAKANAKS